jgi:pyruvate/2-oxoglutarate dehydrogenase complex dihydrolipoamide dehydrogenase (E3) component
MLAPGAPYDARRRRELERERPVDEFDIVVIGAGAAGEAAAHLAAGRKARVAIVDKDLFGGSCPFWACMPSKTLLHAAGIHALGGHYPWPQASKRRDYMISREGDRTYPDDSSHVKSLQEAGATVIRGEARFTAPGSLAVRDGDGERQLAAGSVIIAVGSFSKIPPVAGLERIKHWTNRDATSTRDLPRSLLILGGGPTGVELAQVFGRYSVPTAIADSNDRLLSRDHPKNSAAVQEALRRDGVTIRTGVRATRVLAGDAAGGAHRVEFSDGTTLDGHEILLAVGRSFPLDALGLDAIGVSPADGPLEPDDHLRIAPDVYVAGDPAGPELHTHLAHYEGEMAVRIALGDDVTPDLRAIPRATYTDPETASVGLRLDEAEAAGIDAFEETADVATSAKGYVAEAGGHVTVVVDRGARALAGVFIAGPAASETIHEAVLALKLRTPLPVLADTIHAFPTLARVMGSVFATAAERLTKEETRPA